MRTEICIRFHKLLRTWDVSSAETRMRRSGPARVSGRGSMHWGCVVNGLAISDLERAKLPGC